MSERNSVNEMFGQLKNYQVKAPLEVMELAISKANRKRNLKILVRWSAAVLLLVGAVLVLNWESQNQESTAPLRVTKESVIVAPTKQKTFDESTTVSVSVVAPPNRRSNAKINSSVSNTIQNEISSARDSAHSSIDSSSPVIESKQMVDSSAVTPEVLTMPSEEQQVKKSKPNGQRKLKLIIPQP